MDTPGRRALQQTGFIDLPPLTANQFAQMILEDYGGRLKHRQEGRQEVRTEPEKAIVCKVQEHNEVDHEQGQEAQAPLNETPTG